MEAHVDACGMVTSQRFLIVGFGLSTHPNGSSAVCRNRRYRTDRRREDRDTGRDEPSQTPLDLPLRTLPAISTTK